MPLDPLIQVPLFDTSSDRIAGPSQWPRYPYIGKAEVYSTSVFVFAFLETSRYMRSVNYYFALLQRLVMCGDHVRSELICTPIVVYDVCTEETLASW